MSTIQDATETLLADMNNQVQEVWMAGGQRLAAATACIKLVKAYIHRLSTEVMAREFSSKEEEITYFKFLQPQFYSALIYYTRMASVESGIPLRIGAAATKSYEEETARIQAYLVRHHEIYRYYRMGLTYLDDKYFLRHASEQELLSDECILMDSRLVTMASFQFARIMAYERLMADLQSPDNTDAKNLATEKRLKWEAQKVQLAELIYALDAIKAFGNVTTVFIAEMTSKHWNVQLSFIHKTFEEIRLRKKNRTPFLDLLKNALNRRMDEDDDK